MLQQGRDGPMGFRLREAPRFHAWAEEKREGGENETLLARLEELSFWMRPSELAKLSAKDFQRMLDDLKHEYRNDEMT